jgi:hypothetical protein
LVWQLFWLLFPKFGQFFSESSGHPSWASRHSITVLSIQSSYVECHLGNCDIHAEQMISYIQHDKMVQNLAATERLSSKNLSHFTAILWLSQVNKVLIVHNFGPNSSEKVKFGIAQKFRSFFFLTEMMLLGYSQIYLRTS